jgi:hypothetical protein
MRGVWHVCRKRGAERGCRATLVSTEDDDAPEQFSLAADSLRQDDEALVLGGSAKPLVEADKGWLVRHESSRKLKRVGGPERVLLEVKQGLIVKRFRRLHCVCGREDR